MAFWVAWKSRISILSLLDSSLTLCPICPQGKFIRIHFGATGKLASADIETCEYQAALPTLLGPSLLPFFPVGGPILAFLLSCLCQHLPLGFRILFPLKLPDLHAFVGLTLSFLTHLLLLSFLQISWRSHG